MNEAPAPGAVLVLHNLGAVDASRAVENAAQLVDRIVEHHGLTKKSVQDQ